MAGQSPGLPGPEAGPLQRRYPSGQSCGGAEGRCCAQDSRELQAAGAEGGRRRVQGQPLPPHHPRLHVPGMQLLQQHCLEEVSTCGCVILEALFCSRTREGRPFMCPLLGSPVPSEAAEEHKLDCISYLQGFLPPGPIVSVIVWDREATSRVTTAQVCACCVRCS